MRHIPLSEYAKRRAYWLKVNQLTQEAREGPGGVVIEHTGFQPEADATIVE